MVKKILLLGGSAQQVIVISTAKKLGYYTVLCDYLTDNPGQYVADKFYLTSTTDKNTVLKIAISEAVDGVLAYASDPAAPTAAYIAEKLNLPTNPFHSVDILCNKDKFRKFLLANGFNTPISNGYDSIESAQKDIHKYEFPVIIKPVDSSGSKGATVLYNLLGLEKALEAAFLFSRSKRIIIEKFIDKKHPYLIGGDIFVIDGRVMMWGLMNCHRDSSVNTLVPVGKSYPLSIHSDSVQLIKDTLQKLVTDLDFRNGAMNVELIIDNNNYVWPIDIGPRSGGNMIPDLLGYIFNVDVVEMAVKIAMNEKVSFFVKEGELYWSTHNLHSNKNGILEKIIFDPELQKYIVRKNIYKKQGDKIDYFDNASKAIGIIFMKFETAEQMYTTLKNINNLIKIELKSRKI